MFGPIGKVASAALTRAGYQIYRPTEHENHYIRSVWEDWFSNDPERFASIYKTNRKALAGIDRWFDEDVLRESLWRYGVPEQWDTRRQGVNVTGLNEIEKEVTYSDLIAYIGKTMESPVRYLEIGVSVGKNFLQMSKHFDEFTALDVELLNPALARQFSRVQLVWQSDKEYIVDTLSGRPTQIKLTHQQIDDGFYIRGDQFASDTWLSLQGKTFNLVFSDGIHSAEALRAELEHLLANDLIPSDGPFVMYWDDLVEISMQTAFVQNAQRLQKRFGKDSWFGLHWIHGTYGQRRLNGVFSTFTAR